MHAWIPVYCLIFAANISYLSMHHCVVDAHKHILLSEKFSESDAGPSLSDLRRWETQ